MARVRRLAEHEWSAYRDARLRALLDSPDAFGSTFDRERARSDAEWRDRVSSGATSELDLPLVVAENDEFTGLAWGRIDPAEPETAHIFQMWVAPEHRGQGFARSLLATIVSWAQDAGARRVLLQVTCGDSPARRLYGRAGFEPVGQPEPLRPGAVLQSQRMRLQL